MTRIPLDASVVVEPPTGALQTPSLIPTPDATTPPATNGEPTPAKPKGNGPSDQDEMEKPRLNGQS